MPNNTQEVKDRLEPQFKSILKNLDKVECEDQLLVLTRINQIARQVESGFYID